MARGKKKEKALTPEEKLAQALVPEEEQPYKVPENWSWIRLGSLSSNQYGYTSKAVEDDSLPKMLRITDIQDSGVDWRSVPNCKINEPDLEKYLLKPNDIVIARIGATTGKSFLLQNPINAVFASYLIRLRFSENYIPAYVYHFLQSDIYWKQISDLSSGIALPGVNSSKLQTMMFPSAPKAEQQRIVDRIESLFAKLDEAKEKAQSVLDSFETRKAAILHKAFTGELTAKWREEHGLGLEDWNHKRFDEVAKIKSNLVDPAEYQDFPHIAPDNIEKKTGVLLDYHTIAEDGVTSGKHRFYPGQILYSKIRPYLSKVVVVDFDGLCSADMYPIEAKQDPKCLWYYMLSEEFLEQASSAGSRSVLPKINQKELSGLMVNLPSSIAEQEELVQILDNLFAKEQQAKDSAEAVLEQIDLLKKSILARAFRGELGTNDPTDEPAIELLKRIL